MLFLFRKSLKYYPQFFMILGALSVALAMVLSLVNIPVQANQVRNSINESTGGELDTMSQKSESDDLFSVGPSPTVDAPTPTLKIITETPTSTFTNTPTSTPTDMLTETPTFTPTNTFTNTPTSTPTSTFTNTPTSTPTSTFTNTATATPTSTFTNTPTFTPTKQVPNETPMSTPTFTPTSTPTETPTSTPTKTEVAATPSVDAPTPTPGTDLTPFQTPDDPGTTPDAPTSTPGVDETPNTNVQPTLPPPVSIGTPSVLIPVTGAELANSHPLDKLQTILFNLGLSLFGIGLVLQSLRKRF